MVTRRDRWGGEGEDEDVFFWLEICWPAQMVVSDFKVKEILRR